MAAFDVTPAQTGPMSFGRRVKTAFITLSDTLTLWADARRTRKTLHALSDRELDDIGLARGDIERVAVHQLKR